MPNTSKKKSGGREAAKPGIIKQFLIDTYSSLPDLDYFVNGHVLYLYITSNKSQTETIRKLLELVPQSDVKKANAIAAVKKVVDQTLNKFKKPTDKNEFRKFSEICKKKFVLKSYSKPGSATLPTQHRQPDLIPISTTNLTTSVANLETSLPNPESSAANSATFISTTATSATNSTSVASAANSATSTLGTTSKVTPVTTIAATSTSKAMLDNPVTSTATTSATNPTTFLATTSASTGSAANHAKLTATISISPRKTRHTRKCACCRNNQTIVKKMREEKLQLQKEKRQLIIDKSRKHRNTVRTLNQTIKRRDTQIGNLRQQLQGSDTGKELVETKKQLSSAEKKHVKLKKYHKKAKKKIVKRLSSEYAKDKKDLATVLKEKNEEIIRLQNEKVILEDEVQELKDENKETRKDGKSYSSDTRMMVFDSIVNQVPTGNVPKLLKSLTSRCGLKLSDVPHRTTVEAMTRELGSICELQTAEVILANRNCTLGFDATTQEGTHINSIHITTKTDCYCVSVDELAGGRAEDYHKHIYDSIDNLAKVYCYFNEKADYLETRQGLIDNISNSMTDRCAANHAAIRLLNATWNKILNELNCHLHPLDSFSTKVRKSMKDAEVEKGKLFGSDCIAGNIVLAVSKLRYKDGKGDPQGFKVFLDSEGLARGLIPRYRGNRLHVLFHTAGVLIEHQEKLLRYLEKGVAVKQLRQCIVADFKTTAGQVELQVLGLIGKLLTGPWMTAFYTKPVDQINHGDAIKIIKDISEKLRRQSESPLEVIGASENFFGENLHKKSVDTTVLSLMKPPKDPSLFAEMMKASLQAVSAVIEKQYEKYFSCNITDKLDEETMSARSHNIDAEEVMGMFSSAKQKSPNATICYISCKMRAQKNRVVEYLNTLSYDCREAILTKAVQLGKKQRQKRRLVQEELRKELLQRSVAKQQKREEAERRKLARKLKGIEVDKLGEEFPELEEEQLEQLTDLLTGKAVGKEICQTWALEDGTEQVYNGKIVELNDDGQSYVVGYWLDGETYDDDAEDFDMKLFDLAADFVTGDLVM